MALIDGALLGCASDTRMWGKVARRDRKESTLRFNACMRHLARAFSNGRFRRQPEELPREVLTALLYEAGDIAEEERLGTLATDEANAKLWTLARRGLRRYGAKTERIRWGCVLPRRPGEEAVPYPINPDSEFLARFAFWKCASAVDIREWRRFTIRECGVDDCDNSFVEARTELRGGPTKRCPTCRAEDRRTK